MKRWIAREASPIEEVVRAAGGDEAALDDGRVFVGRVRAKRGMAVNVGAEIVIHAPPPELAAIEVLLRTDDLVAVVKPAGIPTIPDHGGASHSLLAATARASSCAPSALHPTSRLDRDVSGVVIFARTSAGAAALLRAREEGKYLRRYVALTKGVPSPAEGRWDAPIGRHANPRLRTVRGREARPAATRYRTVRVAGAYAWLVCEPETGRTHQIRVHASHAGAPLLGDGDYGGPTRVTSSGGKSETLRRIYLHCELVEVTLGRARLRVEAPVPEELERLWARLR